MNASEIARRAQARAVFANSLTQQKSLDNTCLNRVVAGPAAATSYSATKVTDKNIGAIYTTPLQAAEIVAISPCALPQAQAQAPIVYPNYEVSCSDPLGVQIMATGTFTSFTFTTTSLGAGCIDFQFFTAGTFVSSQFVVLGVDSNLITPSANTDEVRYIFKCNPIQVTIDCSAPPVALQYTVPYCFYNPAEISVILTLTKYSDLSTETHTVEAGQTFTPTPAWGWYYWSIPCP